MSYTLTADSNIIVRDADGAFIPADPRNADYQKYKAWQAAGNTPAPHVTATPVPSCQLWQLQAVMTAAQWAAAQNAIASLNNPAVTAFFQHGTNVIPANSKTLAQLGAAIGLTAEQVASLVQQASAVSIP